MISRRLFVGLALADAALAACGRETAEEGPAETGVVRFSVLSFESRPATSSDWKPIVDDMERSTGLRVAVSFVASEATVIDAMRSRRTDLSWLSNQSALQAVRRADAEVFARAAPRLGDEGDHSILIVSGKSKLSLDRVLKCDRTLTLGLGETLSTAANLTLETYLFASRGISPAQCFRQVSSGDFEATLAALAAGRLDVAATSSGRLDASRRKARSVAREVREIWRSPALPESPLVWRRDLDPAIKEKLRQFFLTYGQDDTAKAAEQRENLARIGLGGFAPADDSHLVATREMEATHLWLAAKQSGDKVRIVESRRALDAITAERLELEARTGAPAAAQ
ncbi:MAG TPA: phosphate/phosphite/phosphonate ABC transporter substrate-binding protein [Caulobacteraceae bacterium]